MLRYPLEKSSEGRLVGDFYDWRGNKQRSSDVIWVEENCGSTCVYIDPPQAISPLGIEASRTRWDTTQRLARLNRHRIDRVIPSTRPYDNTRK